MEPNAWNRRVDGLARNMTEESTELPPLIVEYRQHILSIRDSNTRYAVTEQRGWSTCWVLIWYNTEKDYRKQAYALS